MDQERAVWRQGGVGQQPVRKPFRGRKVGTSHQWCRRARTLRKVSKKAAEWKNKLKETTCLRSQNRRGAAEIEYSEERHY